MSRYLGIEIGGTKLQIGLGDATHLHHLWRGTVDPEQGGAGIRQQILDAIPELLRDADCDIAQIMRIGIGFGGPVDDVSGKTITSHQITGWDDFPLIEWCREKLQLDAVMGNDADVAGLAEAVHGAGRGLSPIYYVTIGSGIGGALIVDGEIYRGVGKGAAEIGHLRIRHGDEFVIVEHLASGWAIGRRARDAVERDRDAGERLLCLAQNDVGKIHVPLVAQAASEGDALAIEILKTAWDALAEGLCSVITLLCPRRIVIGGGVSLLSDQLFVPLRRKVAERVFRPFADCYDIVPASLGEEVVVRGALTLAHTQSES